MIGALNGAESRGRGDQRTVKEHVVGLFDSSAVASGYASSRPYFHPEVMRLVRDRLALEHKLGRGIDIGCGAGLSSIALTELVGEVVGIDSSVEMLGAAIANPRVRYVAATAERLPFDGCARFEIATLAGSFNWVDRQRTFAELSRLLAEGGWIVIYDNNIRGEMRDVPEFAEWYRDTLLARYPRPPRNESEIEPDEVRPHGLEIRSTEDYANDVSFSLDRFVSYLFTQSNLSTVVNRQPQRAASIDGWLRASLAEFFGDVTRTLLFGGYVWFLEKRGSAPRRREG